MADNFQYYRTTVFVIGEGSIDWTKDFAIVTAFNPEGDEPGRDAEDSARLNQAAHLQLKRDLRLLAKPWWLPTFLLSTFNFLLRDRTCAITGCSPDFVHRETGWAANITLDEALHLGRIYRQEAIFWISAGQLYLVSCAPNAIPEPLGPWSSRLRTFPQNK